MNARLVTASVALHLGLVSAIAAWSDRPRNGPPNRPPTLTFQPSEPARPIAETPPESEPFEVEPTTVPDLPPPPTEPLPDLDTPAKAEPWTPADPLGDLPPRTRLRLKPPVEPVTTSAPPPPPPAPTPTSAPAQPAPQTSFVAARALTSENRKPEYPHQAVLRGWTGTVVVRLSIDATGQVTAARIITPSAHPALNRAALRAVRSWRFEPAHRGGVAVGSDKDIPIDFQLIDR